MTGRWKTTDDVGAAVTVESANHRTAVICEWEPGASG